jgi:hypothetical protein
VISGNDFHKIAKHLNRLIALLFLFACLQTFSQTTTTTFTQYTTNPAAGVYDFNYTPFRGYSTWQGNCGGCSPIPTPAGVTARDRYYRWPVTDILDYNATGIQFNWTRSNSSDNCFDCEMNAAIDAGGKLSIDIHFQCGFCGGHGTQIADPAQGNRTGYLIYPKAWHNAMQADAVKDFTWSNHGNYEWFPNLNGSTFQNFWKQLHQGVMNHLNTTSHVSARTGKKVFYKDAVNYVVVSGYGQTGEWTNTPYGGASGVSGKWPGPEGTEPTVAALDSIISTVAHIYDKYWVINQIATFDCKQLPGNTHIPIAVGWFALQLRNSKGFLGIRDDGIGNGSQYIHNWTIHNRTTFIVPPGFPGAGSVFHFDTAIQNGWKIAPIVGEPCCPNLIGGGNDPMYSSMPAQVALFHFNGVDNGNSFNGGEARDIMFQQNWRVAAANSGNKMVLTQVVSATTITSGTAFTITPTWNNIGVAPPYLDWTVIWELKSAPGARPVWTDSSTFNMKGFLPGKPTAFPQNYKKTIKAGTYNLYLTVKDPRRYYDPMPLYITATQNIDGSYLVRSNVVVSSG